MRGKNSIDRRVTGANTSEYSSKKDLNPDTTFYQVRTGTLYETLNGT